MIDRPRSGDDLDGRLIQAEADRLFEVLQERGSVICWSVFPENPSWVLRDELRKRVESAGQRADFALDEFGLHVRLIDQTSD